MKVRMLQIFAFLFLQLLNMRTTHADCVVGAKMKQNYQVLDTHTILLKGGAGKNILIKSFAFFYATSQVSVLKDSFCDYENAVLYVDGQPIDAQQVKGI